MRRSIGLYYLWGCGRVNCMHGVDDCSCDADSLWLVNTGCAACPGALRNIWCHGACHTDWYPGARVIGTCSVTLGLRKLVVLRGVG